MKKNYDAISETGTVSAEEMELINRQSLKKLSPEEVFTFSVILCDNEIDRDFEVFSEKSLENLEKLFVGKTGILNHSNRSEDQQSRTYKTQLIHDSSRKTACGDDYKYLKAWCYTVRSPKNEDLIRDIESGIKKEVSISCSSEERVCSVCGESICTHRPGKYYGDALCYKTIEGVNDAYEWSFVAIPAQRSAGVTKKTKSQKNTAEKIQNAKYENEKSFYARYRRELKEKAQKGFALAFPELPSHTAGNIIDLCSSDILTDLVKAFNKKISKSFPIKSQFQGEQNETNNSQFKF